MMAYPWSVPALRQRLLRDIAELQERPYPNIRLHVQDDDLSTACLVLTPENCRGLHLTVFFGADYPLSPPWVIIQSSVDHPDVVINHICGSILNTEADYTPAYTLKAIAIQLLSSFSSDSFEQAYGGERDLISYLKRDSRAPKYRCEKCRFGCGGSKRKALPSEPGTSQATYQATKDACGSDATFTGQKSSPINKLPDELLLLVLELLEFEELTLLAKAWPRIEHMITGYDLIRTRELQCFVLRKDFRQVQLGVGVSVTNRGRPRTIQSEFDLISRQAFDELYIRKSVYGLSFERWLPLPIHRVHWRQVQKQVASRLASIASLARYPRQALVMYGFMNDIVVRFNLDIYDWALSSAAASYLDMDDWELSSAATSSNPSESTLRHASEKAIESYFHLFHLLLCIATSPAGQGMVPAANRMLRSFMAGNTSKEHVPNLGYLLVALLISDVDVTETLMKAIITEAITRTVVWLLDIKGANMAELAYLEADEVSDYRLKKTFVGTRTSYRLLMFSELFRRTARPSSPAPSEEPVATASTSKHAHPSKTSSKRKPSLVQLGEELFDRHGAPPPGAAARLASEVRRLQEIEAFPPFLREMGVSMPSKRNFTEVLRGTVRTSMERGYSVEELSQEQALALRLRRDRSLDRDLLLDQVGGEMVRRCLNPDEFCWTTFFPWESGRRR